MRPMPSTQASPTHGDFLGRTQGAIERSGSRDDSLAKVELLLLQNIQNTQPGTAKNIIEEKHTKYKVLFCNECHYLCSPPFGLHKQIFSTTAGCHPPPLPLPTMLNSCCGSWDVLGSATYSGHAVIFVLPLSVPLSLHLLLPGARFTVLPVTLLKGPQMLLHLLTRPPSFFYVLPYRTWEESACKPKACSLASMEG